MKRKTNGKRAEFLTDNNLATREHYYETTLKEY